MKRMTTMIAAFLLAAVCCTAVVAQPVKYRLVKYVDRNSGAEHEPGYYPYTPKFVFVVFLSNDKSKFVFTDYNGNLDRSASSWSIYGLHPDNGQRTFVCTGSKNNYNIFENRRPIYGYSGFQITQQQIKAYVTDYVYFSYGWDRFNLYSGGTAAENGIGSAFPNNDELIQNTNYIAVYERVESRQAPTGLY